MTEQAANQDQSMSWFERVQRARQRQLASRMVTEDQNLEKHVGKTIYVTGLVIERGVKTQYGPQDKVTIFLGDQDPLFSFKAAAVESAQAIIDVLGEGPYPKAIPCVVKQTKTKWGTAEFIEIHAGDPSQSGEDDSPF